MKKLYALLIGINQYEPTSRVSTLKGCVNDCNEYERMLLQHFGREYELHIVKLQNEAATYQNIIDHFGEKHLLKARPEDVVFFSYSGHGAQEKTAEEFMIYEPSGMEETLVCYDSRTKTGYDLADKELAVLIDRVAQKCPQITVIMDCCNSGSNTKDVTEDMLGDTRQTYNRKTPRPYDSYLSGYYAQRFPNGKNVEVPRGKHILLAACHSKELARELKIHRGLFSYNLMKVLQRHQFNISYSDLFQELRVGVRRMVKNQTPQFETIGFFDSSTQFITGKSVKKSKYYGLTYNKGDWEIEAGALHGIPANTSQQPTFAIYEQKKKIADIQATLVGFKHTEIPNIPLLNPNKIYSVKLTSSPGPKRLIQLESDGSLDLELQKVLADEPPVWFELSKTANDALYQIRALDKKVFIFKKGLKKAIRVISGSSTESLFVDAFDFLDHICQWHNVLELDNDKTRIPSDVPFEIKIFKNNGKSLIYNKEELTLYLKKEGDSYKPIPFQMYLNNPLNQTMFYALYYQSSDYAVHHLESVEIPALGQIAIYKKDTFTINGDNGISQVLFKVVCSTEPIDSFVLEQKKLELFQHEIYNQGAHRNLGSFSQPKIGQDWRCFSKKINLIGQSNTVGSNTVSLNDMIHIAPHPAFRSEVSLNAMPSNTRNLEDNTILNDFFENNELEVLDLSEGGRSLEQLPLLTFSEMEGDDSLKENPLQIDLNVNLQDDETILPLAFDGEFFLPVGEVSHKNGKTTVKIDELPADQTEVKKSIFQAAKLCFLKLVLKQDKGLQILRWVDYSTSKARRRKEGLEVKIKESTNIAMVVHGIIGNTKEMAESLRKPFEEGQFDLVLSFDYENLNTPIQQTAKKMGELLEKVGLTADSGKSLTIVAHSMGGLVSRSYIENLGGKAVVKKLVQLGTPNAGSNIAKLTKYRGYALTLMAMAANFGVSIPAAATIALILNRSKVVTPTLEQMDYENEGNFLIGLAKNDDPKIPYHIIAGDLHKYVDNNPNAKKLMEKILNLGGKLFYGETPNDIACSVNSIFSVPENRVPNPQKTEVACHHLNYFNNEDSLEALWKVLG